MPEILARCQTKSIAPEAFQTLATRYVMACMKTIGEIRRDNLEILLLQFGSLANLNEKLELARTDSTLSQIRNRSTSSRGKPRAMGDDLARKIEAALDLDPGWMDNVQYPPDTRQHRIQHVLQVMESMEDWQVDQAVKIVDTIAEPAPRNGTTHGT